MDSKINGLAALKLVEHESLRVVSGVRPFSGLRRAGATGNSGKKPASAAQADEETVRRHVSVSSNAPTPAEVAAAEDGRPPLNRYARLRFTVTAAIASALVLGVGCESVKISPVSPHGPSDQPGLGFEPSSRSIVDAYDLIVYDRIERKWREVLETSTFMARDHSPGRVKVTFHLHRDGRITDSKVVERTAKYSQAVACAEAIKRVSDLPPWPPEVENLVWSDYRELTFTFYYTTRFTRLVREPVLLPMHLYDRELINAIQRKWYRFLDQEPEPTEKGEVRVEFILHRDGTITNAQIIQSSVNARYAEICRQAVLEAGPFAAWPEDMRRRRAKDHRKVGMTFYYEK